MLETRHLYYTAPSRWQVIEERLGSSTASDRQFISGLRYVDDLVLRDRASERLYAIQDGNWNVTAISDADGPVQERYAYSAYGVPLFLTDRFVPLAGSKYAWVTLYAGYRCLDTGIFPVRNRAYHPVLGLWMQRDPLGVLGSDYPAFGVSLIAEPARSYQGIVGLAADVLQASSASTDVSNTRSSADLYSSWDLPPQWRITGNEQGAHEVNLYIYCGDNALRRTDPSGLQFGDSVSNAVANCLKLPTEAALACLENLSGTGNPALEKAVCAARAKLQHILKCESLNAGYKALKCKGCNDPKITAAEAAKRAVCLSAELSGRSLYLKNKCDYVLAGSIARGSAIAEQGHKAQVAQVTIALGTCAVKAGPLFKRRRSAP